MTETTPPPPPGAPPAKKGLPGWAWVAIGCGGLIVVAFVAFAALSIFAVKKGTEMAKEATGIESFDDLKKELEENPFKLPAEAAIRLDPDLELIESDSAEGTITFRHIETGEVATFDYREIAEGRLSLTTEEGELSFEASGEGEGGMVFKGPEGETRIGATTSLDEVPGWVPLYPRVETTQSTFHTRTGEKLIGSLALATADGAGEVIAYYKEWLSGRGWEATSESMSRHGDGAFGQIDGEHAGEGRRVQVVAIEQGDATRVTINYEETAP